MSSTMDRRDLLHGAATLAGWGLLARVLGRGPRTAGPARPRPGAAVRLGMAQDLRPRSRGAALRGPGRPAAAAAGGPDLGPVRGDPLPPRPRAVGRHRPAVPGAVLPPRQLLPGGGADLRGRRRQGAADRVRPQPVRLRPDHGSTRRCRTTSASPAGGCTSTPTSRRTWRCSSARPISAPPSPATSTASPAAGSRSTPALSRPEEFPRFTPLLAGPAAARPTHAHRLRAAREREHHRRLPLRHLAGRDTTMDVTAALYPRKPIERLGIAPMTSMF